MNTDCAREKERVSSHSTRAALYRRYMRLRGGQSSERARRAALGRETAFALREPIAIRSNWYEFQRFTVPLRPRKSRVDGKMYFI